MTLYYLGSHAAAAYQQTFVNHFLDGATHGRTGDAEALG